MELLLEKTSETRSAMKTQFLSGGIQCFLLLKQINLAQFTPTVVTQLRVGLSVFIEPLLKAPHRNI